jgi:hypothetical protein
VLLRQIWHWRRPSAVRRILHGRQGRQVLSPKVLYSSMASN